MPRMKHVFSPYAKRVLDLQRLIDEFKRDYDVEVSEMRFVLAPDEWKRLKADIKQLSSPAATSKPPREFDIYNDLVRKADQIHYRPKSKNPRTRGPGLKAQRYPVDREDSAYELALVYLEKLLNEGAGLHVWLDRDVCFDGQTNSPTATVEGIPRLRTSRSTHSRMHGVMKKQRCAIKLAALHESLKRLQHPVKSAASTVTAPTRESGIRCVSVDPNHMHE
jgi:hypothetical protein